MNFSFKYNGKTYTKSDFRSISGTFICDFGGGVSVTAEQKHYEEFNASEWVLWFENTGSNDSLIFSDIKDCDIKYTFINPQEKKHGHRPTDGFPAITCMKGMVEQDFYRRNERESASEFSLYTEYFFDDDSPKDFECIGGRSSDGTMPFFDVHTKNDGMMVAIGWTGGWHAHFLRVDNELHITTGLQKTHFYLKPGEKLRTTSVLTMEYHNEDKYNKFRRLIKKHFSHKAKNPDARDGILASELWGSIPSEKMIERVNNLKKHDIKIEDIWVDAGWYGKGKVGPTTYDPEWGANTGNWNVNTYMHKNGFVDVAKAIEDAGYGFMLWFEPERAIAGTPMTLEHPDWFLKIDRDDKNLVLNLGDPDAWNYAFSLIDGYVKKLHLSCYRQDYNIYKATDIYFAAGDEKDRVGITEIKHIMGVYRLFDSLLENNPELIIDNCASGGRRIDIETLKRSIPFFRSDYQCVLNGNADVLASHNTGAAMYFPYIGGSMRSVNNKYDIRCSYSSSWGLHCYSTIFDELDEDGFSRMRDAVNEYRRIRHYFSQDFYNHGTSNHDDSSWTIWQYHSPETQSGIVMAFRKANSPFESAKVELKGMCEKAKYRYIELERNTSFEGNNELSLTLPEKRSSVILEYKII